jgi:phosphomevalonate kinase
VTRIVASAPGKLVLLGEYAVLEGAPALVLAVDRRASALLGTATGGEWEVASPTLGLDARLRFRGDEPEWTGAMPVELTWVATLLARFPGIGGLPPGRIELESASFHLDQANAGQAASRVKLGLGSSAALAVALLGALHAYANLPPPTLAEAIDVHRAIQHGRGSGIDIAASLAGGLNRFELREPAAIMHRLALPASLRWCCVYSGRPASTGAMLAKVAAWHQREPAAFAQRMHELATISSRGVDALASHDADAFLTSLHDYAQALACFGEAAGADIASREHRMLGELAARCGCVYKSCGAGGGDVGVTFAVEDERLRAFASRAAQSGFALIGMEADTKGLVVASTV